MAITIKVTKSHYENRCMSCEEREGGELEKLQTPGGRAYFEVTCEPVPKKSACKLGGRLN